MTGSRTPRPAPPASARNLATRPPRTSYRYRWSSGSNKRAAHDAGVKAKPLRGGPRPAWTPTPHPRLPKPSRKTRNNLSQAPHQDLTGSAPSWMTPKATVSTQPSKSPRLPPADFQRSAPYHPRYHSSVPESCRNEASTRVNSIHPFGLPLTRSPRTAREPLGFPLSFAPGHY